jgi:hypothetical protein
VSWDFSRDPPPRDKVLHEEWARPEEVKESGKAANPRGEARRVVVDRSMREEIASRRSGRINEK